MPNLSHSNKAKPRQGHKAPSSVHTASLSTGAKLLTEAVASFVALSANDARSGVRRASSFVKAYSSLVNAVPKESRLALLRQMSEDIEKIAETELEAEPADLSIVGTAPVTTDDFMAELRRQEKEQRERDIAAQRLLPGSELRARLGVSPQALSAALKAKRMFVMQGPSGGYYYPAFFADAKHDRHVLERVCKALGDLPAASKWDFFTTPKISLGNRTPLEALVKGKLDAVLVAAAGFLEE